MSRLVRSEAARTIAGTALTGTLQDVGAVTSAPGRIITIMSDCDLPVVVSWDDGVTEGFSIPAYGSIAQDISANTDEDGQIRFLAAAYRAKKSAGTTSRSCYIDCYRFYNKLTTSRFSS